MPDVNILVYAFRSDAPHHQLCRQWLEDELSHGTSVGISSAVLASLVRITTHRRIFTESSNLSEAMSFCDSLLSQDAAVMVHPGDHHWAIFGQACQDSEASGNLVQDAWFAALAIESGSEWITMDRDFAKFPGLRWRLLGS